MGRFKQGFFLSHEFVGASSWNGFERNCLFSRRPGGGYVDVARVTGADVPRDGRGVAIADLDGDGRLDIVISNNDAAPTVLLNRLPTASRWLRLDLRAVHGNPDAVGAEVRVRSGGRTLTRVVEAGSGYASQSSYVVHFGLGDSTGPEALSIRWPSGTLQELSATELRALVPVDSLTRLVESKGVAVAGADGARAGHAKGVS